jgi:hypothetical protein
LVNCPKSGNLVPHCCALTQANRLPAQRAGGWNFRLTAIYFVAILDFEYDQEEERRKFRRDVALKDQDGDLFYDKLHFKFLQMPLFHKKEHELADRFDKWCFFLKNLESFDHIPAILNEPIFKKAFGTAALTNLTAEQRDRYEMSLIQYWDRKGVVETAAEEAREEGRQEGREEGLQLGKEETQFGIAKNAILKGASNDFVAEITGLPVEKIEFLCYENQVVNSKRSLFTTSYSFQNCVPTHVLAPKAHSLLVVRRGGPGRGQKGRTFELCINN